MNSKDTIRIKDKEFELYLSAREIHDIVGDLTRQIFKKDIPRNLVVCPVLTGSFMFASDLLKMLPVPLEVNFIKYKSYIATKSGGTVKMQLPFTNDIAGKDILIVEDIIDSGLTVGKLLEDVKQFNPNSIQVCTLLYKPEAFKGNYTIDFVGKEIVNEFVVGYGMDYCEEGRNLPCIYKLKENE